MRKTTTALLFVSLLLGASLLGGCSDDSTGPGGGTGPQSEELTHSWSARFGDENEQTAFDVAIDASGNTVIVGSFWGTIDFGGGALASAGSRDIFVAKFGPDGTHLWSQSFGDAIMQDNAYVAVDASGNILITGGFYGVLDFGGGDLVSAGSTDIFVAKLDPNGAHIWSDRFGNSSPQWGSGVAADASGNVFLAGRFTGSVDFGGGNLASQGYDDIFLAKLAHDGTHIWSQRFGDASAQYATDIAVDASGNATITGYLEGIVDFGGGALTTAGSVDIFVASFDPDGAHRWSNRFGDSEYQLAYSISCDGSGNISIAGVFEGAMDFGGGSLTCAGSNDAFIAAFGSMGTHLWSKRFGDASEQVATCIAADASGNVILGGFFTGDVEFGGDAFTSAGTDAFIARFSSTGMHLWSDAFGDADYQGIEGVTASASGYAVVTGTFQGSVDFGGSVLTSAGSEDIFVAKFE